MGQDELALKASVMVFNETWVSERKPVLAAERPNGRSGSQRCVQREAARQTVSSHTSPFRVHIKYFLNVCAVQ